jgi:protein-S-isoprenylcysteine O-methyltransferase Ste14
MPMSAYLRATVLLICAGVALFGSAGHFGIPAFWIYLAIFAAVFIAAFAMLDRGLLQERMRPGGRPAPLGLRLLNVVLLAHWIIAGLDRGRLHWTDAVPAWLQGVGLVLVAIGYALVFWAMLVNRFFSSVVRIQSDRGQHVVIVLASGIALGSWLAAAFLAAVVLPFLVYRVLNEDRVLQSRLEGYADYVHVVPWRLIPGLW